MSIFTPEVASLCGALDSDAVQDGEPFSAHFMRALIRSSNRLIGKEQPLCNLYWPEVTGTEDAVYPFEGIAPLWWVRAYAPIPLSKRPGLTSLEAWLRLYAATGHVIDVYLATKARPWTPYVGADLQITGSAAFVDHSIPGIPLLAEGPEEFELWLRGQVTATLADVGYGSPNTNTGLFVIYGADRNELYHAGSTWNFSGINSLAQGGHAINFYDADGVQIGGPRQIVAHTRDTSGYEGLRFAPPMSPNEVFRLDSQASYSAGGSFEIVRVPTYIVTNLGAVAEARSP